ncbi:gamma-glutamyltransferase [Gammaproteobacteria bacterium]|nr:gamma-glutamyltransferase [Gammaproteobacteria bacterium]MDC1190221.1 gamma-glutamyltransferase [Gammaproteobacteria bacterium]
MKYRYQLLLALVFFHVQAQQSYIDYVSPFHPIESSSGMVVSQNDLSSQLGTEILNKGGNAVDAAVAVGFSLAITLPRAGNLGGGGFMLVYIKEKQEIYYIDYRSSSPLNANIKDLFNTNLPKDYKKTDFDKSRFGHKASAIPGTVAGLLEAHRNFGKLSLKEILEPVIKQASEGIKVSYDLNKAIESTPQLFNDPESRKIYFDNGKPLVKNTLMKRPDLAETLSHISANGHKGFYEGPTAKKIVEAMNANNGFMTLEDFKNYKVNSGSPISILYRGNVIFTAGPPSGGGVVLLTALKVLESYKFKKADSNSARTYHLIAEALRRGHNNRSHEIGDPNFYNVPIDSLLSKERIKTLQSSINFKKATPSSKVKPFSVTSESRDTTHYSIIDSEGNAVSNTYTLGYSFGSGVTIPGTGILLNNQMNNFAYRYGDDSVEGRAASKGNRFIPGKRPMSTMAPSMVFNSEGSLTLITGSPGGSFIPAAILRVISGVIDFDLNIGEATMLSRIHKDWPYSGLDYETTLSSDIVKRLDTIGHKPEKQKTLGSTQSIHIINGVNYGYADLRRPGASVSTQSD